MDAIADSLNVKPKELIRPNHQKTGVPQTQDHFNEMVEKNKKEDYTLVRDNLVNMIREVELVVSDSVEEVRSNPPNARIYESFAMLVRTFADLNKDLMSLHKDQTTQKTPQEQQPVVNNNAIFVGTNEDLIDTIKMNRGFK